MVASGEVDNATVVLNAPSYEVSSHTVISHLSGTAGTNDTIIVYTHSESFIKSLAYIQKLMK